MKVCDIVQFHSPLSGGVKRYISDKQRFIAGCDGVSHLVIVPSHRNAVVDEGPVRTYEIKSRPLIGSRSYRMLLNRRKIESIIREERPDLIEVGDPYYCAWVAAGIARCLSIPIVAFYHSDYPRALDRTLHRFGGPAIEWMLHAPIRRYLYHLYNRMNATVVATRRLERELHRVGIRNLVQIPLGTNADVFRPRNGRQAIINEIGLDPDTLLLLYVGRLAREKNIRSLVAMMEPLRSDDRRYHLIMAGDGELHAAVREAERKRSDLTWLPHIDSADLLAELYSAADLFVHAGTCETFGIVSLEAQACGTPVLAVRGGGLEETLGAEWAGMIADSASPDDLAAAVRAFGALEDPPGARQSRRNRIVRDFSCRTTYQRLFKLYSRLSNCGFVLKPDSTEFAHEPTVYNQTVLAG